ncbi:hypothetical protein [Haloechinothrix sp. LS1_15]|uniref:TAXI family TRAP transporter solute-binding subunit n=1 Tax=Haloechinothrix sp. LS1_15 TaxID=2652248 RepID=UPI0029476A86|nr:hypothetical protein [Haloechinothrix sp. LS1_15]MDV6013836.1 TRAP transporter substrate-binding protein [Haloechinothrix sp. LS1_15]
MPTRSGKTLLAMGAAAALVLAACNGDDDAEGTGEPSGLAWATSDTGSAGHSALVALASMLNDQWDGPEIDVLPTAGAVQSVNGYAMGEFAGYYGADVAFEEMAGDTGRFEDFSDRAEREPVQSFWAYPMETGLAVHARDADELSGWGDLAGEEVFTGPRPWDVRANLERAMDAVDVGHSYVEVDNDVAGSALEGGDVRAIIAYTAGESDPPPWLTEAELQTDLHVLNPDEGEVDELERQGFELVEVDASVFGSDVGGDTAMLVPFFYGFHVGVDELDEDAMYEKLTVISDNVEQLAQADGSFDILAEDMAEMQRRGVEAAIDDVEVHPGLARWMADAGVWDEAWDDRIAQP